MNSILIKPKSEKEYLLVMDTMKKLRITAERLPDNEPQPISMEEYYAMIDRGLEDIRAGRTISHEEMKKKFEKWSSK